MKLFRGIYIFWIFFRYGLDELLLACAPQSGLRTLGRIVSIGRKLDAPRGVRLRMALEKLGPLFVKFGQVLSTRRDIFPPDVADELALLQDRVPPFDGAIAIASIEAAFRKPITDIFTQFDPIPVASASIAQVHFAQIRDRNNTLQDVAVKVLRPNILPIINQDIALMRFTATWLERLGGVDARRLKLPAVVEEFSNYLHDELDLLREAANATQLRRNLQASNLVLIPEIYWNHCTSNVLVMQRMSGIPISQTKRLRELGVNIQQLARHGIELFFTEVFRDGYFHADMHPGNIMVSVEPDSFGRLILVDFGIVGTLSAFDKEYLAQNFAAFFRRDYRRVAELHIESGWIPAQTRVDELETSIRAVCEPYFDRPLRELSLGMVLVRLFQVSRRFQLEIQPQLVLLQKTLLNIEGLGRELDPELDLWSTAQPFLENWMREQLGPRRLFAELRKQAPHIAKILPDLPVALHQYLQQGTVNQHHQQSLQTLIEEQKQTNALLRRLIYGGIGFVLGIAVVVLLQRVAYQLLFF